MKEIDGWITACQRRFASLASIGVAASVVVAEDSFVVREGLSLLLEAGGYEVAAAVEDFDSLMAAAEAHRPQVVITDIRMPPTHTDEGIRAARSIRSEHPDTGVVVFSHYVEPEYALRLFEDGSAGLAYLLKERVGDAAQLDAAIATVQQGGSMVDPTVVDALVEARASHQQSKLDRLTRREADVMGAIARGLSNAAIAERLVISERAVEKYVSSIFTKLDLPPESGVNRRVRAVLVYLSDAAS